jgi:hypothetical protein
MATRLNKFLVDKTGNLPPHPEHQPATAEINTTIKQKTVNLVISMQDIQYLAYKSIHQGACIREPEGDIWQRRGSAG